jgi:hypothetical protein
LIDESLEQFAMRAGIDAGVHHHRNPFRHFQRGAAQIPRGMAMRPVFGASAAMLAGVAVALGRAGALAIAGIRAAFGNIIVRSKSQGGTPSAYAKATADELRHTRPAKL